MLFSMETARMVLSRLSWILCGFSAMAILIFAIPLFPELSAQDLFVLSAASAGVGLLAGMHFKYRSDYGSGSALVRVAFGLFMLEFLLAGGGTALALQIAGRSDLGWLAFHTNASAMIASLAFGMYREGRALQFWSPPEPGRWKSSLLAYLDYENFRVVPELTEPAPEKDSGMRFPFGVVAAGVANIPLLFEVYAGGRNNAIFLAAPLMTAVLAYVNVRQLGPGIMRLLLLRKLEKELGRRFVNADLEQIQALRRSYFLSRWLMKDYAGRAATQAEGPRPKGWSEGRRGGG